MFEGFSDKTVDFMWGIRLNNEKTWFEAHKQDFIDHFQTPMKSLAQEVYGRMSNAHPKLGLIHKVSRIYRDARRLRGRGPYRDNLWFSMERPSETWTETPVFWFELSPDNWSYGLGYYSARADTMAKFRAQLDQNPEPFARMVRKFNKQTEFVLDGPEYARKKEPPIPLLTDWYNKKSLSLIHDEPHVSQLYSRDLINRLVEGYESLLPFYDYFIALDALPAPTK